MFVRIGAASGLSALPIPPSDQPPLTELGGIRAARRLCHGGLCTLTNTLQSRDTETLFF